MKLTPEERRIEENMQPGNISANGFLGQDTRNLTDIIRSDQVTVDQLGLSHQQIANRLRTLTDKGKAGLGRPVILEDEALSVTVEDYRGMIPCPFQDHISHDKRLTTCTTLKDRRTVRWSDLNIHMIEAHGFYEGRGSPFRIEPETVAAVLFKHCCKSS